MQKQPTITIRDLPASPALSDNITKHIDKLEQFYDNIMHCDVVIEHAQNSKHQGKLYNTRIDLAIPGGKLVSNHAIDEDVYISIRDAFKAMRRQLQEFGRQQRGEVKSHPLRLHGEITKLFKEDDFGFISCNGEEYYFSVTNLHNGDFNQLKIGMTVRFLATADADGLRAVRVTHGKQSNSW